MGHPVGSRSAGLAHRVLGDGTQVPRRVVRHPRRRARPGLPAPRERDRAVEGGRRRLRELLAAQRLGHDERREDEQVPGQLAARRRGRHARSPGRTALLPRRGALPVDDRVLRRLRRRGRPGLPPDRGLPGPRPRDPGRASVEPDPSARPAAFDAAMDDDIAVPQALAVLHETVREGNAALATGSLRHRGGSLRRGAGDGRRAGHQPVGDVRGRMRPPAVPAGRPRSSMRSCRSCWRSGRRRGPARTSRLPMRSATASTRSAFVSRTRLLASAGRLRDDGKQD